MGTLRWLFEALFSAGRQPDRFRSRPDDSAVDCDCESQSRCDPGDAALAAEQSEQSEQSVDSQAAACRKYLERNPDERIAGLDPWWHYSKFGGVDVRRVCWMPGNGTHPPRPLVDDAGAGASPQ